MFSSHRNFVAYLLLFARPMYCEMYRGYNGVAFAGGGDAPRSESHESHGAPRRVLHHSCFGPTDATAGLPFIQTDVPYFAIPPPLGKTTRGGKWGEVLPCQGLDRMARGLRAGPRRRCGGGAGSPAGSSVGGEGEGRGREASGPLCRPCRRLLGGRPTAGPSRSRLGGSALGSPDPQPTPAATRKPPRLLKQHTFFFGKRTEVVKVKQFTCCFI